MLNALVLKDLLRRRCSWVAVPFVVVVLVFIGLEATALAPELRFREYMFLIWPIGPVLLALDVNGHRFSRALAALPVDSRTMGNTLFIQSVVFFPALGTLLSLIAWLGWALRGTPPFSLEKIAVLFLAGCAFSGCIHFELIHLKESVISGRGSTAMQGLWGGLWGGSISASFFLVMFQESLNPWLAAGLLAFGLALTAVAWKQSPRLTMVDGGRHQVAHRPVARGRASAGISDSSPHLYDSFLTGVGFGATISLMTYLPLFIPILRQLALDEKAAGMLALQVFIFLAIFCASASLRWTMSLRALRVLPLTSAQMVRFILGSVVVFNSGFLLSSLAMMPRIGFERWALLMPVFALGAVASTIFFGCGFLLWRGSMVFIVALGASLFGLLFATITGRLVPDWKQEFNMAAAYSVAGIELVILLLALLWLRRVIERSSRAYRAPSNV